MRTAESLIQEKSFQELNPEELALVMELVEDEQSFNDMKHFFIELDTYKSSLQVEPSPEVKASLDQVFKAKHPGISIQTAAVAANNETSTKQVRLHRTLWFRIAAILVVFIGISLYFLRPEPTTTVQTSQAEAPVKEEASVNEAPVVLNEPKAPQPLLAQNAPVESEPVTKSLELDQLAEDLDAYSPTSAGSVISYAERGMSADVFVNSDKDLASKSFAQPISPDVLMQFLEPAF